MCTNVDWARLDPPQLHACRHLLQADPNNGQYTVQKYAASSADAARIRLQFTEVGAIDWAGALLSATFLFFLKLYVCYD